MNSMSHQVVHQVQVGQRIQMRENERRMISENEALKFALLARVAAFMQHLLGRDIADTPSRPRSLLSGLDGENAIVHVLMF